MDKLQVKQLLIRYVTGNCTAQEEALLETWYIKQEIPTIPQLTERELDEELDKIWSAIEEEHLIKVKTKPLWPKLAVAASLIALLTFTFLFYNGRKAVVGKSDDNFTVLTDVKPGGDKAILIDALGNELLLKDKIYLAKNPTDKGESHNDFNTIITPKGGQYQVVLPDGTHVWLNAASSIKFPISFSGSDRTVEITGEAYFEVAHNRLKPFRVTSKGQIVEVLGTHFNINTYLDEPAITTTLLEGRVKVLLNSSSISNKKSEISLKPGEQAIQKDNRLTRNGTNVDEAVAWKNGFFQFDNADLETVMRQISRWYDLDVRYTGPTSKRVFNGKVYRNMSLTNVLNVLSFSKVNYKIDGKRLIITP